jgi:fatty acid amide hydrolase
LIQRRAELVKSFMASLDAAGYDVILCPPDAVAALPHDSGLLLGECLSYAALPVLVDMPAGVVAATRVRRREETDRPASLDLVDRAISRAEMGSAGLPVGVQVIGRPWREDVVLAVMDALETHFRRQPDCPERPPLLSQLSPAKPERCSSAAQANKMQPQSGAVQTGRPCAKAELPVNVDRKPTDSRTL